MRTALPLPASLLTVLQPLLFGTSVLCGLLAVFPGRDCESPRGTGKAPTGLNAAGGRWRSWPCSASGICASVGAWKI